MNAFSARHLLCIVAALGSLGNTACAYGGYSNYPQGYGAPNYPQSYGGPYASAPSYARGGLLPNQYRQDRYAVRDWQQRNLRAPPDGYRWYQDDAGQFVLAAIATGIILEIISQSQSRDNPQRYRASSYSRGDRLPSQYRQGPYVVGDWRQRNLRPPPDGYQWYRDDAGQILLAAIATGIILEIISESQSRGYPY